MLKAISVALRSFPIPPSCKGQYKSCQPPVATAEILLRLQRYKIIAFFPVITLFLPNDLLSSRARVIMSEKSEISNYLYVLSRACVKRSDLSDFWLVLGVFAAEQ